MNENDGLKWSDLEEVFIIDGSLMDVLVNDMTVDDWERFFQEIKRQEMEITLKVTAGDFAEEEILSRELCQAAEFLSRGSQNVLYIQHEGMCLIVYAFAPDEMEVSIDPKEVSSLDDARHLFEFMQMVALFTDKRAVLVPEGASEYELLACTPDGTMHWGDSSGRSGVLGSF